MGSQEKVRAAMRRWRGNGAESVLEQNKEGKPEFSQPLKTNLKVS